MKRNILYSFIGLFLLGMAACQDDEIRPFDDELPEGETVVSATVEFNPLTSALDTRSVAGDAIKNINTLVVLAYDTKGDLKFKFTQKDFINYSVSNVERDGHNIAEKETPRASFQLKIPYGYYRLYAVANMGDLDEYSDAIATPEGLKAISLKWNEKNPAANNQMFGYFTLDDVVQKDTEPLRIGQKGIILRARIRRLASKVTLAFDGSLLHEGVFVYIKSARIKDIPDACFLGDTNTVKEEKHLIENGDVIIYGNGPFDESYPARVTAGMKYYPRNENYEKVFHTETEQSLFFYENMQGTGKDKKQDPAKMGKKEKGQDGYKDNKPCGTYIEVEGYYHSINPDKVGAGKIIYRFMLGKNTATDFNAERNHHYKLTMKFKNFANDVDWHIDYEEEEPGILVPEIYYISYLYNHSMMMPVKVNTGGYKLVKLEAKIDTNSWAPYNAGDLDYYKALDPYNGGKLCNYGGFLSLRKSTDKVVAPDLKDAYKTEVIKNTLTNYYTVNKQGDRVYDVIEGERGTDNEGKYIVKKEKDKNVWNFQIPMYTRAKQLAPQSAYTGNNPFEAYRRKAVVTFMATLESGTGKTLKKTKRSVILQERRLINPKGVWRKYDNDASFRVTLKALPKESSTQFQSFTSEGKWRAYVIAGDKNFVKLDGKDTVRGSTGSVVDFNINLNGTIAKDQNRFAIVQVDYHDYSCQHLIFVRQGDEPVALVDKGTKWLTYNLRTKNQLAQSPCEEGSMFRFGKLDDPIDAEKNIFDNFKDNSKTIFSNGKTWAQIGSLKGPDSKNSSDHANFPALSNGYRIAKYADYRALYVEGNNIENGFGVLYGNDATETQNSTDGAFGYGYYNAGYKTYGMRGCFVYNSKNGKHVFFPIGASGHGHRKDRRLSYSWASNDEIQAVLRYASSRNTNFSYPDKAPLFYDLYRRPGGIYWLQETTYIYGNDPGHAIAWDFNYFTFDFNSITSGNVWGRDGSDACFIRCVKD